MSSNIKKSKIVFTLSVVFFLFLFLNDNTIYSLYFRNYSSMFLLLSIVVLFFLLFISHKILLIKRYMTFIFVWLLAVLLSCCLNGLNNFVFVRLSYWSVVLVAICVIKANGIDYIEVLYVITKVYCVWGLICYLYTVFNFSFIPVTDVSSSLLYKWYKIELYGYIISKPITHLSVGSISLLRLDRPFGEPGIAQMYYNFGLLCNLFYFNNMKQKKVKWFWFILFSLATILSFSLTGYFIYLVIIMIYLLYRKKRKLFLLFLLLSLVVAYTMVTQKVDTVSYSDRLQDYTFMFDAIIHNLPFGIGIGNTGNLDHYIVAETGEKAIGFYCGLLYPLAQYGFLGFFYYYVFIRTGKSFSNNIYANVVFWVYMSLTLLTEPQAEEPFIMCLLFGGLLLSFINKNELERKTSNDK